MRRFLKLIGLLFLVVVVAAVGSTVFVYWDLHHPVSHANPEAYVEIPRVLSSYEIMAKLRDQGIIRRAWPLWLYVRVTGSAGRLKAGEYKFPTPISPMTVLRRLNEGGQRLARFTIIEGWTRWEIADAMAHIQELHLNGPDEALTLMDDTTSVHEFAPEAKNLEGMLFPDTYSFPSEATSTQIISGLVKRFKQEWKPEWNQRAAQLGVTPYEAVTIASIIETEAKLKEERPIIASVIYNRLKKGMPLGVDSTLIYASKLAGTWRNDGRVYKSDIDRQSPYNTRNRLGLPPGPVGSPGESSLNAALNPASTNYLYYVREPSRNDGEHNFYSNAADFEKGVQALRDWEKQRDARNGASTNSSQAK